MTKANEPAAVTHFKPISSAPFAKCQKAAVRKQKAKTRVMKMTKKVMLVRREQTMKTKQRTPIHMNMKPGMCVSVMTLAELGDMGI